MPSETPTMNLALFDLDLTLLPLDSDHAFGDFLVHHGWADGETHRRRNDAFYADYLAGTLDMVAYIDFATSAWRQRPLEQQEALRSRFMAEVIAPAVRPTARRLVEQHRARGDLMALVTATNEFVTAPIAGVFGFEHLISTELVRDAQGQVTGQIRGVANLREGKVHNVDQWLKRQGKAWSDFTASWCYSDSSNDLPLLERVTYPVATNPGAALERMARDRSWPILNLFA
jgi:HAD superfamily hydrolase (TIGR01490 family)